MKPGPDWKRYIVWVEGVSNRIWEPVEDFDDFEEAAKTCDKYFNAYVEDTEGDFDV